jgi:hypothetical protein
MDEKASGRELHPGREVSSGQLFVWWDATAYLDKT